MLKEPQLFSQEPSGLTAEFLKFAVRAVGSNPQVTGVIQAHQTHVAGGIGCLSIVADEDLERLGGGDPDKFPNFLKRTDPDAEFLHKIPPQSLYKWQTIVYN